MERGLDIFEKRDDPSKIDESDTSIDDDTVGEKDAAPKPMTVDELYAMRMEIMPHLLSVSPALNMGFFFQNVLALLSVKCRKPKTF